MEPAQTVSLMLITPEQVRGVIAVDASAVLSILLCEPEAAAFARSLITNATCLSAVSLQEASMVLAGRRGQDEPWRALDGLLRESQTEIVPHDRALARLARDASLRFGKGRHPAALNFGDCFSYALARKLTVPLLYKGDDFSQTDIAAAI